MVSGGVPPSAASFGIAENTLKHKWGLNRKILILKE